jgi:hypothetical protein
MPEPSRPSLARRQERAACGTVSSMVCRRPARSTRSGLSVACFVGALAALLSCREQPGRELLQVDALLPPEAQFGDAVQILGDGFGLGSPATVTFRGEVYRAGRTPERVELAFRAQTESQRELSLVLPREAERAFCGAPEDATHSTFRGDVEVAIAARGLGAPPATGTARGVVIELYPAVKTRGAEARSSTLGRAALEFLGLELGALPNGGLEVLAVEPHGRAAAADLRPGDRVLRAGGVTVLSPSDLVPGTERAIELVVARDGGEAHLRVDVDGFSKRPPAGLRWAVLPLLGAALWFFASASPLPRLLGWLGQNWLEHERARRRALRRPAPNGGRRAWPGGLELFGGPSGLLVWLGVGAALLAPLLRRSPVDVSRGLLLSLFASAVLLVVSAFARGLPGRSRWSLASGCKAAAQQWLSVLPSAVALLAVALPSGVDLDDVAHAQGPWPWQWNAFQSPGSLAACAALLGGTLPRPGKPIWRLVHARPPRLDWRSDGDGWFDRLQLCSCSALAASVFMGGDAVPPELGGPGWIAAALSATVLLAKYTALVLSLSFVRGLCLGSGAGEWWRFGLWVCLPVSIAAVAGNEAWRRLSVASPFWDWLTSAFAPACVAIALLAVALLVLRAPSAARQSGAPSPSPWL